MSEPNEVGWYAYSGGRQTMIFHLRETGQWSVHLDNGDASDCAWGYIEQALGVWDLVRVDPTIRDEAPIRTAARAVLDAYDAASPDWWPSEIEDLRALLDGGDQS